MITLLTTRGPEMDIHDLESLKEIEQFLSHQWNAQRPLMLIREVIREVERELQ